MAKTFITDPKQIPPHMMSRLNAYINHGTYVGGFLQAVISNDLKQAVSRADDTNINLLPAYVIYLYNEAPALCWGSRERFDAWIAHKEAQRKKETQNG